MPQAGLNAKVAGHVFIQENWAIQQQGINPSEPFGTDQLGKLAYQSDMIFNPEFVSHVLSAATMGHFRKGKGARWRADRGAACALLRKVKAFGAIKSSGWI